jgi:hypothetical protein
MSTVHELLFLKGDHRYHLYLRTGYQYKHLASRRKEIHLLKLYKDWVKAPTEYQTTLYRTQRTILDKYPDGFIVMKSTYLSFPTEIPNEPSSQNPPSP